MLITCLTLSDISKGQENVVKHDTSSQTVFFDTKFKWRILIPKGFDTVSAKVYASLQKQGIEDLEKTANQNVQEDSIATRICAYQSNIFNYFEANKVTFDSKIYGNFYTCCRQDDDQIYAYYKKILFDDLKIDTIITNEKIDGYDFRRFQLHIEFGNKRELNMDVYSRLFDDKEFTLVIVYANRKKGDLILSAWRKSTFGKD